MAAEFGSDCHSVSQSLFPNMETVFTQRIQMRSFLLIHSLFKRIFFFELELRFASSLMVQGASGGPGMFSAFPKGEDLFLKRGHSFQMARCGNCDGPREMA